MKPSCKKGFTLIEMMIVVIIVGILAVVTLPKFSTGTARANDAARRTDIKQLASAIMGYKMDKKIYPPEPAYTHQIENYLIQGGMSSVPYDPGSIDDFSGVVGLSGYQAGDYEYTPIIKNGVKNGGFVLMASMETSKSSNYVVCTSGDMISTGTKFTQILYCDEVLFSGDENAEPYVPGYCRRATANNFLCYYTEPQQLRYILKY